MRNVVRAFGRKALDHPYPITHWLNGHVNPSRSVLHNRHNRRHAGEFVPSSPGDYIELRITHILSYLPEIYPGALGD
jgi:hypothetical protein